MSSNYEGMSNSMIEAFCTGLPIITTKVSGTDELVKEKVNGYLVELNDVDDFASKLAYFISNEEARAHAKSYNDVHSDQFKMNEIVKKWISLISFVIS